MCQSLKCPITGPWVPSRVVRISRLYFKRQIERLDRGEASTAHGLPVPVIYDEDELACQGGGSVHEPVIVILIGVRAVEEIEIEGAKARDVQLAKGIPRR